MLIFCLRELFYLEYWYMPTIITTLSSIEMFHDKSITDILVVSTL